MSVNYPDSEWTVIDGVRYRKTDIKPKVVKSVEVKKTNKDGTVDLTVEGKTVKAKPADKETEKAVKEDE